MVEDTLTIGEVAKVAGVPTSTIRYYERRGILPRAQRVAGQRQYCSETLRHLAAIRIAKEAGFSLKDIKTMALSIGDARQPSKLWTEVASQKLEEIDALIERAEGMRETLQHGLGCGCRSLEDCPAVEGLVEDELLKIGPAPPGGQDSARGADREESLPSQTPIQTR